MATSLFVHGICVLVPGTCRSIGDVPFDVIGGARARQAIGVLDRLGCPKSHFTVYIIMTCSVTFNNLCVGFVTYYL